MSEKLNVYDILKRCQSRISYGFRWMVVDEISEGSNKFVVYKRAAYAIKTIVVYQGTDEDLACRALLGDDE